MAIIKDDHVIIRFHGNEGETLHMIQHSLLLGIEKIASAPDADDPENRMAVFVLSELLREVMLSPSQLNFALGKKPYK